MKTTSPYIFYKNLAESENLEFADLRKNPCDLDLLSYKLRDEYLCNSVIPWKKTQNGIILATTSINKQIKAWVMEHYGDGCSFAITTPLDEPVAKPLPAFDMISHDFYTITCCYL